MNDSWLTGYICFCTVLILIFMFLGLRNIEEKLDTISSTCCTEQCDDTQTRGSTSKGR